MRKKLCNCTKFLCLLMSTVFCLCSVTTIQTYAYNVYGYRLNANMDELRCYYPSELAPIYGVSIMRGATCWQTSDGLDFTLRWYGNGTVANHIVMIGTYYEAGDTYAYTEFFRRTSQSPQISANPRNTNWDFCRIIINTNYQDRINYTIMAHEFGHVMGLAHNNTNPNSIMCQDGHDRTATLPSAVDIAALNSLY